MGLKEGDAEEIANGEKQIDKTIREFIEKKGEKERMKQFIEALEWFAEGTDQWDFFKFKTKTGTEWFVDLTLKPLTGSEKDYRELK